MQDLTDVMSMNDREVGTETVNRQARSTESKSKASLAVLVEAKTKPTEKTSPSDSRVKCPVCNQNVGCGSFLCQGCQPNMWVHPRCGGYTHTEVQIAGKGDAKNDLRCNNCKEDISLADTVVQTSTSPPKEKIEPPNNPLKCHVTTTPTELQTIQSSICVKSPASTSPTQLKMNQSDISVKGSYPTLPIDVKASQSGVHLKISISSSPANAKTGPSNLSLNCPVSTVPVKMKTTQSDIRLRCPVCSGKVGCGTFLCLGCQPNRWVHPECGGYNSAEVQVAGKSDAKKNLRCNNCKEEANSEVGARSTIYTEGITSQPYFCVKCKDNFQSYGRMVAHTKHCMVKFKKEKNDYEEVIRDARVPEVYSCEQCDERFHYYKHLIAHKKSCKQEEDSDELTDETDTDEDVCFNNELRSKIYNLIHRSIVHSKNNKLRLTEMLKKPYGKMIWKTLDGYGSEQDIDCTSEEKESETNTVKISFECDKCGKSFSRKDALNRHMKLIHTKKNVDLDATRQRKLNDRKLHMKVPSRKLFCCQICKKCFGKRENLNKHKEIHKDGSTVLRTAGIKSKLDDKPETKTYSGTKTHCCEYCGKHCINNTELQAHTRVHTGEKPFGCDVCGKCFIRKHHLTDHINGVHLKLRPYRCNVCKRAFFRSNLLNKHMKLHANIRSDQRSYKCNTCRKCFSSKNIYNVHVRKHRTRKNS